MMAPSRIAASAGLVISLVFGLAACSPTTDEAGYSTRNAGFANVALLTDHVVSKETVWLQDAEAAQANAHRVSALVRGKTIDADTAVQVALLNNRGLQAAYADLGASAAEAWQQTLLPNPRVSIGAIGIGTPGLEAYKSIEAVVGANLLAFFTRPARISEADAKFQSAQLQAIDDTLRLANETRSAWINAVAAFETTIYLNQAQMAADAASELARELGETGALSKSGQAREHVFLAELAGRRAKARLAAQLAKEELARLMGLWGDDLDFFVPDYLPDLPAHAPGIAAAESEALRNRPDLRMQRFELEAAARRYGLTDATRYVSDLELLGGFEKERELEDGDKKHVTTGQVELEFEIPIFDSGEARLRKAELQYMKQANLLAEKAVNVRAEARTAAKSVTANHQIARHYRNAVLPLRALIADEALLTYNGMITNTFELLEDTRARTEAVLLSVDAKREFWLAANALKTAIHGGSNGTTKTAGDAPAPAGNAGGGH